MKKLIFNILKSNFTKTSLWEKNEDDLLLDLSKNHFCRNRKKIEWKKIAAFFSNKTQSQCYRRFITINPIFKKGKWTKEEDDNLLNLHDQFGKSWSFISKIMKNRSSIQIRSRFNNHLNPEIIKKKFTKEEDLMIEKLYEKYANQWSKYNKFLPNRSLKNIKRRYLRLYKKKIV